MPFGDQFTLCSLNYSGKYLVETNICKHVSHREILTIEIPLTVLSQIL